MGVKMAHGDETLLDVPIRILLGHDSVETFKAVHARTIRL
jgi:hypothetical protein